MFLYLQSALEGIVQSMNGTTVQELIFVYVVQNQIKTDKLVPSDPYKQVNYLKNLLLAQ